MAASNSEKRSSDGNRQDPWKNRHGDGDYETVRGEKVSSGWSPDAERTPSMTSNHQSKTAQVRLARVKAPWLSGAVGLTIILVAFVGSLINASLQTPNSFISMTLQPFIFVGMGLLLYHIGIHVHAVHQNVLMMAGDMTDESDDERA
jgi:hypothetical protein